MTDTPPSPARTWFSPWVMALVVFAATLACYWPALPGTPVWDDAAHLTAPELRSTAGLLRIWTDPTATQQFYPVLHSAFWIEHRLWGDAPLGYHLLNVLLHVGSACLLALLLRRLWRNAIPPSVEWIAALLFALHPVCVESVAWISEQKNTLSLFFALLATLSYLAYEAANANDTAHEASSSRRRAALYLLATVLFVLALGTKTVTAVLPAALLVITWWQQGRVRWRDVLPLLPWLAIGVAFGLLTASIERTFIGASGAAFELSASQRVLLAGRNVWFYLGKLGWPADLMFVYPRWNIPANATSWLFALLLTAGVTVTLWAIRRRTRGPLAAWLLFVGCLFPALGFFNVYPFRFSYVADHFQYHASLAVFSVAAAGFGLLLARTSRALRSVGLLVAVAVLGVLGVFAHRQSRNYRDSETLYRATLAVNPDCWLAHNNLGEQLSHSPSRLEEAIAHYREALRLKPEYPEAHNNLGNALASIPGRIDEAIAEFEAALQREPYFVDAQLNLANALATQRARVSEALRRYDQLIRQAPDFVDAHFCHANVLAALPERRADAIREYERTLQLRPTYIEAHENFANLLASSPDTMPQALEHYATAIRLAPGRAHPHYNLAVFLSSLRGRENDAIAEFREALRLDPANAPAHNNLGVLYATLRRYDEARTEWEQALRLAPDFPDARRNLDLLQAHARAKQPVQ